MTITLSSVMTAGLCGAFLAVALIASIAMVRFKMGEVIHLKWGRGDQLVLLPTGDGIRYFRTHMEADGKSLHRTGVFP